MGRIKQILIEIVLNTFDCFDYYNLQIKQLISHSKTALNDLVWALKLWSITSIIPLSGSVLFILFFIIYPQGNILTQLWELWSGYYVTSSIGDIKFLNVHVAIILLCWGWVTIERITRE